MIDFLRSKVLKNLLTYLTKKSTGFCSETRWLRRVYFLFGMSPIYEKSSGKMRFNFVSYSMLYSVTVYIILSCICMKGILLTRLHKLMAYMHDFDTFIYNFMFLSFVKTQYFYAVGGWLAAKDLAKYHNMWTDFEKLYCKRFNEYLNLESLEKSCNRGVFICIALALGLIFGQLLTLPTYTLQECIGYIPSSIGACLYVALMVVNCLALQKAAECLFKKLERDLKNIPITQDVIILHKDLWNNLSNIILQFSKATFNYSFIMLLGAFIDLTASGYGYLSLLLEKLKTKNSTSIISLTEFGLIVASVWSLYLVVHVSNSTHYVTQKMEKCFIDELCMATTRSNHPKVNKEIELFLLTIKNNPPVVSLGGYVNLDRQFITKVISMITTYYVVLIQFKISLSQSKKSFASSKSN